MSRIYEHISEYEEKILKLNSKGFTLIDIGEKLKFTCKQVHDFITQYNRKKKIRISNSNQAKTLTEKGCDKFLPCSIEQLRS